MSKPIINIDDIDLQPWPAGASITGPAAERYDATMGFIAQRIGAQKLGYNITAVPPGKSAFPLHNHHINEEMFFILQGSGEVQIGEEFYPIRAGDFIACPPGGRERAHKMINTSTEELRFLAVSTKMTPDVVDYPNSGKFGVVAEFPTAARQYPALRFCRTRRGITVGEPTTSRVVQFTGPMAVCRRPQQHRPGLEHRDLGRAVGDAGSGV